MKWFIVLVVAMGFATLSIASSGSSAGKLKGKDLVEHFTFNSQQRTYLLHLPPGLDKAKPVPLLVMLHYYTGTGKAEAEQTGFSAKADVEGFIAVYPDGPNPAPPGYAWDTGYRQQRGMNTDAAFVGEVIQRLSARFAIDRKRIYVCGMSQGAMATHAVGCELSSVVAAIAPVNGILRTKPKSVDPISVIIIHGTKDDKVPYYGVKASKRTGGITIPSVADAVAAWVAHDDCSAKPKRTERRKVVREVYSGGRRGTEVVLYTRVGGGHEWPGDRNDKTKSGFIGADEIWEFFKQHPKH